jgi:hypothetical protein
LFKSSHKTRRSRKERSGRRKNVIKGFEQFQPLLGECILDCAPPTVLPQRGGWTTVAAQQTRGLSDLNKDATNEKNEAPWPANVFQHRCVAKTGGVKFLSKLWIKNSVLMVKKKQQQAISAISQAATLCQRSPKDPEEPTVCFSGFPGRRYQRIG